MSLTNNIHSKTTFHFWKWIVVVPQLLSSYIFKRLNNAWTLEGQIVLGFVWGNYGIYLLPFLLGLAFIKNQMNSNLLFITTLITRFGQDEAFYFLLFWIFTFYSSQFYFIFYFKKEVILVLDYKRERETCRWKKNSLVIKKKNSMIVREKKALIFIFYFFKKKKLY